MSRPSTFLPVCLLLTAFLVITAQASMADIEPKPPMPDETGNYHHCRNQKYWIVVDQDWKNGLSGRLSPSFPKDWDSVKSRWPEKPDVNSWPTIICFYPGMILNGCQGNCGTITMEDRNGNPWLMVTIGIGKVCFVRANSRYIKPAQIK